MILKFFPAFVASVCLLSGWSLAAPPKYFEARTPNFIVLTDTSELKARRLAEELETRALSLEAIIGPVNPGPFPIRVFIFEKPEPFLESVPRGLTNPNRAAYLVRGAEQIFVTSRDKSTDDIVDAVGVALGQVFFESKVMWRPFWLSEAISEYFRKVQRPPDTKPVSADESYPVEDLLTIVPSSTYDRAAPRTPFRVQAYRLLRVVLESSPDALREYVGELSKVSGRDAKLRVDVQDLQRRLSSYVESPLRASGTPGKPAITERTEEEWTVAGGDLLVASGRPTEASNRYTGDSLDARVGRAVIIRIMRPAEEARRSLERSARELESSPLVLYYYGALEAPNAAAAKAQMSALNKAIELVPKFGRAYAALARTKLVAGAPEEALSAIETAIELEPAYADRFFEIRADVLQALSRFTEAIESIRMADALPHFDAKEAEYFARRVDLITLRIENTRRAGERQKLEKMAEEARARAAEREPPPARPAPPARVSVGQVSYEISATMPVEVVDTVFPDYPEPLRRAGRSGKISLRVTIGVDGKPAEVLILKSDVPELNDPSVAAIRQWAFKPVVRAGKPTTARVQMVLSFLLP